MELTDEQWAILEPLIPIKGRREMAKDVRALTTETY